MKKQNIQELERQNEHQNEKLEEALQLMEEADELRRQVPIFDNMDFAGMDAEVVEKIKKQNELLVRQADLKFEKAKNMIREYQREMSNQKEKKNVKGFDDSSEKQKSVDVEKSVNHTSFAQRVRDIAADINAHVKETFQHWKDAVALTGQKLETVRDNVDAYRQATLDSHKVRSAVKTADKIFSVNQDLMKEQQKEIVADMKVNQRNVQQMNQQIEKLYERAMRANERAYGMELAKAGFKAVFNKEKNPEVPSREDFLVPKSPYAEQIKELQDGIVSFVKENQQLSRELGETEMAIMKEAARSAVIERPEDVSKANFDKASSKIREAMVYDAYVHHKDDWFQKIADMKDKENGEIVPRYDTDQLRQIKAGIESGIEVNRYLNPEFSADKMAVIRTMEERGFEFPADISRYADMTREEFMQEMEGKIREEAGEIEARLSKGELDTVALREESVKSITLTHDYETIEYSEAMQEEVQKMFQEVREAVEKEEYHQMEEERDEEKDIVVMRSAGERVYEVHPEGDGMYTLQVVHENWPGNDGVYTGFDTKEDAVTFAQESEKTLEEINGPGNTFGDAAVEINGSGNILMFDTQADGVHTYELIQNEDESWTCAVYKENEEEVSRYIDDFASAKDAAEFAVQEMENEREEVDRDEPERERDMDDDMDR